MEQIDIDLLDHLHERDKEDLDAPEPDPDRFYDRMLLERSEKENNNEKD